MYAGPRMLMNRMTQVDVIQFIQVITSTQVGVLFDILVVIPKSAYTPGPKFSREVSQVILGH